MKNLYIHINHLKEQCLSVYQLCENTLDNSKHITTIPIKYRPYPR